MRDSASHARVSDALNCKAGDIAFVRTTFPAPSLRGRMGTCRQLLGNMRCPCCTEMILNVWEFELAGAPVLTRVGAARYIAIEDRYLFPINPGKDPAGVDMERPVEVAG